MLTATGGTDYRQDSEPLPTALHFTLFSPYRYGFTTRYGRWCRFILNKYLKQNKRTKRPGAGHTDKGFLLNRAFIRHTLRIRSHINRYSSTSAVQAERPTEVLGTISWDLPAVAALPRPRRSQYSSSWNSSSWNRLPATTLRCSSSRSSGARRHRLASSAGPPGRRPSMR